jgi:hypothetical protein
MNSFHGSDEPCSMMPMTEGSWIRKIRGTWKPFMMNHGDIRNQNQCDVKKAGYWMIFLSR